jgi:hypothetical protein
VFIKINETTVHNSQMHYFSSYAAFQHTWSSANITYVFREALFVGGGYETMYASAVS